MLVSLKIVRQLPDGRYELEGPRNRRVRVALASCPRCNEPRLDSDFVGLSGRRDVCHYCFLDERAERSPKLTRVRQELERKYGHIYPQRGAERHYLLASHASRRNSRARESAKRTSTPKWVDKKAIAAVYDEAYRTTLRTGIVHHVDHIWPLRHPKCCGLHVPWNLRVIPALENCTKRNKLPV